MGKRFLWLLFTLLLCASLQAQMRFCSWNLCDMGKSKSGATITFMAQTLKNYDLIALQEVVAGPEGAKAVAKLVDALNRTGAKWEYAISLPTSGTRQKRERYAFLWKKSKVAMKGKPWLDAHFADEIEREPFFGTFTYEKNDFTIVNFHAITKKLQPETEIKFFKFYPEKYKDLNLIFAGDFNCAQSHTVFNPIRKMGFQPVLVDAKTTMRQKCKGDDCLASEFDNIFYKTTRAKTQESGVVNFYLSFSSLHEARKISDHLPIWTLLTFD
ncbi:MAG: endonuclease [Flavobacterium sp.]|uniref:endonuclease/exonuclease/phosphatase family protein n=1 Tax=Flavobacterium sp. TaxID=239 RepID=UPI0011FF6452|nr:endonuclease/exonuclease/phosphatase family protein [Flavobacterium sp.]RZJ68337.1 MAG: endonuclease [Flavobacterium sp.]